MGRLILSTEPVHCFMEADFPFQDVYVRIEGQELLGDLSAENIELVGF